MSLEEKVYKFFIVKNPIRTLGVIHLLRYAEQRRFRSPSPRYKFRTKKILYISLLQNLRIPFPHKTVTVCISTIL